MNKKIQEVNFQIQDLWPIALVFIVTGIGVAFGLDVMDDVGAEFVTGAANCNATSTTACGYNYNATTDAEAGIAKLTSKLPLIATVVVAAVLIFILVRYLGRAA